MIEIKVPILPESINDATVAVWHKKPGDSVALDEVIVEVETDKVVLEVPATEPGVLTEILAKEGETVNENRSFRTSFLKKRLGQGQGLLDSEPAFATTLPVMFDSRPHFRIVPGLGGVGGGEVNAPSLRRGAHQPLGIAAFTRPHPAQNQSHGGKGNIFL